ncbi:hypothetical protein [Romboutsia lituseburensis]|uniref:Uncharacterized protein n=2 Tax=root TaxID=1 RepID=A0A1G9IGF3_9FIRM|nr:hypothetical protein [Romboutsia lituseburensis]CEH33903.1 Hypothetical protein RLITU_1310 [Romboutsia lituseburensis]SDL24358.1 hypothetical protein SAMN04515677_101244 [Romboutsia lituseburensis DSM 797]
MEQIRISVDELKLSGFINYYEDNIKEMLYGQNESVTRINLIDRDYMDVITFDEDYEELEDASDYERVLLDEEYALLFIVGQTYEGQEKFEFIDGTKYSLKHYKGDEYSDKHTIKDIGDLSIDLDHYVGVLIDTEDVEGKDFVISVVNYERGSNPRIIEVEECGDLEEIINNLIERFTI